jgi:transposase
MRLHGNAALTPKQRLRLARRVVDEGWSLTEAAEAAEVSERTAGKWVCRCREEGEAGLADRSSAPRSQPGATCEQRVEAIAMLRQLRMTGAEIAECLGMALSTVPGILTRIGLGKLSRLEPPEPPNRYERKWAGELIHIDVKKLGRIGERGAGHRAAGNRGKGQRSRGAGWEFVHICIDDATRLAYVEVLADEKATTCIGFLKRALRFYRAHGVKLARLMTDNGSPYRSTMHAVACRAREQAHPHEALPAPHQRQGGALHPHPARRLDLRRDLPQLRRTRSRAIRLARLLQSPPTTRLPRPPGAPGPPHRPTDGREQPGRFLHLANDSRRRGFGGSQRERGCPQSRRKSN